jgi:hypothetical protein
MLLIMLLILQHKATVPAGCIGVTLQGFSIDDVDRVED